MKSYPLLIMTADRLVFEGEIISLIVPAGLGYMGVLAGHVPLVSTLTPGTITIRKDSHSPVQTIRVKDSGFLEITRKDVTLLLKTVEEESPFEVAPVNLS